MSVRRARSTGMIRERHSPAVDEGMNGAQASALAEVRQFARTMRNGEVAIRAALQYP